MGKILPQAISPCMTAAINIISSSRAHFPPPAQHIRGALSSPKCIYFTRLCCASTFQPLPSSNLAKEFYSYTCDSGKWHPQPSKSPSIPPRTHIVMKSAKFYFISNPPPTHFIAPCLLEINNFPREENVKQHTHTHIQSLVAFDGEKARREWATMITEFARLPRWVGDGKIKDRRSSSLEEVFVLVLLGKYPPTHSI